MWKGSGERVQGSGFWRASRRKPDVLRGRRSEVRSQRSEVRGQRSEVRGQRSEVRGQRSEVRGQRSEVRGQTSEDRDQILVAEILEVGGDFEIVAAHKLNDALQFVLLFPSHPNLAVLQRALHLEAGLLYRLDNLLRLLTFQALLNFQFLPRMAQRRNIRFHLLDVAQINTALR